MWGLIEQPAIRETAMRLLRARRDVRAWVRRRGQRLFDWRFGVDTAGSIPQSDLDVDERVRKSGSCYEATPRAGFFRLLASIHIDHSRFTFVDVGSGKGAVVLYASEFHFKKVIGIEWSARLHATAEANIRGYRRRMRCGEITLVCGDASTLSLPNDPLVLYLFNPFKEERLSHLFAALRGSLAQHRREFIVICVDPDAAFHYIGLPSNVGLPSNGRITPGITTFM